MATFLFYLFFKRLFFKLIFVNHKNCTMFDRKVFNKVNNNTEFTILKYYYLLRPTGIPYMNAFNLFYTSRQYVK